MGCDMVVALGQATVHGHTLFGLQRHGDMVQQGAVRRFPARVCPPDERLYFHGREVPQARTTACLLGWQVADSWGLTHGLNEHHVTVGCAPWHSKVIKEHEGLGGPELVRLVLERSHSAAQAVEVLTDLITRFGQGGPDGPDHLFLVADAHEAMVLEAAGPYWALQECQQVRAATDVAMIRQDWARVSHGLADHVIGHGWWRDDGSKVDFVGSLGQAVPEQRPALKRWGRASLLLEQQNGHLDLPILRRLFHEHYQACVLAPSWDQGPRQRQAVLHTRFLTALTATATPWAWVLLPGPSGGLYFPVVLAGELPAQLADFTQADRNASPLRHISTGDLDRMQEMIDHHLQDFLAEAKQLQAEGNQATLARHATMFMQAQLELVDRSERRGPSQPQRLDIGMDLAFVAE